MVIPATVGEVFLWILCINFVSLRRLRTIGDYMKAKDNEQNRQSEKLKKLLKKTQALPQLQELSEETIEAEVEDVQNK
jgi:hypothetical protein